MITPFRRHPERPRSHPNLQQPSTPDDATSASGYGEWIIYRALVVVSLAQGEISGLRSEGANPWVP